MIHRNTPRSMGIIGLIISLIFLMSASLSSCNNKNGDPFADAVSKVSEKIENAELATGSPDGSFAKVAGNKNKHEMVLDMGENEEGTGNMKVYYRAEQDTVMTLEFLTNEKDRINESVEIELNPEDNITEVPFSDPKPFRFVRFLPGEKEYFIDAVEVLEHYPDSDKDGLPDEWEKQYELDPHSANGLDGKNGDPDEDKLNNLQEKNIGTNPRKNDSDNDGLPDKWEVDNDLDPLDPGRNGPLGDPDNDGLTNEEELERGTLANDKDSDNDAAEDGLEIDKGTNPKVADTDGDGLLDGWEISNNLNATNTEGDNGADGDPDGDGLVNIQEQSNKTDPNNKDTDDDGLTDFLEVQNKFNPLKSDTDDDGLPDGWEYTNELNPKNGKGKDGPEGDPDSDKLNNQKEHNIGTNPKNNDSDGDGLLDGWEDENNLDPTNAEGDNGADGDPDDDDLVNIRELESETDPQKRDTDGDGLPDGWETEHGLSPTNSEGDNGTEGDPDDDKLSNMKELTNGTHPNNKDTDGDGLPDDWEIDHGLSPTNASGDDGPDGDPDDDNKSNIDEFRQGKDPKKKD